MTAHRLAKSEDMEGQVEKLARKYLQEHGSHRRRKHKRKKTRRRSPSDHKEESAKRVMMLLLHRKPLHGLRQLLERSSSKKRCQQPALQSPGLALSPGLAFIFQTFCFCSSMGKGTKLCQHGVLSLQECGEEGRGVASAMEKKDEPAPDEEDSSPASPSTLKVRTMSKDDERPVDEPETPRLDHGAGEALREKMKAEAQPSTSRTETGAEEGRICADEARPSNFWRLR